MAAPEGTGLLQSSFCVHHTPTTSSSSSNEASNNTGLQFSNSSQQCNICGAPVSGRKASWSSSSSLTTDVNPKRGNSRNSKRKNYDASQGNWLQRLTQAWTCGCCTNDVTYISPQAASRLNEARLFSFKELSRATNAFAEKNQLGEGGFGFVYKGVLPDGVLIAAKKMAANSPQGLREFVSELRTVGRIGRLQHKHLVPLLGWCQHKGQMILVYEYMPGGSLDKVLHRGKQPVEGDAGVANPLTWAQRLSILKGVASALSFLHRGWLHGVVHRDVKSSNILLDKDMTAKLGDFGLAQQFNHGKVALATPHAGTRGYLPPEALSSTGIICDKLDVYSFGALALEVASGRPPVDGSLPSDQVVLLEWVWKLKEADQLKDAIDTRLGGDFDEGEMIRVITVGLHCMHLVPQQRPSMVQVEAMLAGQMALPTLPKSRPRMSFVSGFSNLETGVLAGFAFPLPPPPICKTESGMDQCKDVSVAPLVEHS